MFHKKLANVPRIPVPHYSSDSEECMSPVGSVKRKCHFPSFSIAESSDEDQDSSDEQSEQVKLSTTNFHYFVGFSFGVLIYIGQIYIDPKIFRESTALLQSAGLYWFPGLGWYRYYMSMGIPFVAILQSLKISDNRKSKYLPPLCQTGCPLQTGCT